MAPRLRRRGRAVARVEGLVAHRRLLFRVWWKEHWRPLDALRELTPIDNALRTILLAGTIDRAQLLTAVHLGARGLLLKDATTEVLFEAVACVVAGRYWLGQTLVTDLLEMVRPLIRSSKAAGGRLAFGLTPANARC